MFAVIADAHLGACPEDRVQAAHETARRYREAGYRIVWAGDTFDTVRSEAAFPTHAGILGHSDVLLSGNHDYDRNLPRHLTVGSTLVIHGDLVDFGYAAARLAQAAHTRRGNLLERTLSRLRRWSADDVYHLYRVQFDLSDAAVAAFEGHHGFQWRFAPAYLRMLLALLTAPNTHRTAREPLPEPTDEKFGGYFTERPDQLIARIVALYPQARAARTIIIGHLHHPQDVQVTHEGVTYRLIVLGAMTLPVATVATISLDGTVEVRPA